MATNIDAGRLKRKTAYYPYDSHHGALGASGVDVGGYTGAPVQQEIGALGLQGILMADAGDMWNMLTPVPRDLNSSLPVGVSVVYQTASATAADTVTWIVLYDVITEGVAVAVGTTALNTAITIETVTGTAQALEISNRGVINGNIIPESAVTGLGFISWNIEMDAFASGLGEDKIFLGLLIDYVPKRAMGQPATFNPNVDTE